MLSISENVMDSDEEQTYGGLDLKFLSTYADEFECPVCQLTLRDPVQIVGCGHRLCNSCLKKMKKYCILQQFALKLF